MNKELHALDKESVLLQRADAPYQDDCYMYNVYSLAYWTQSLVFVRHLYDLLCGLFSNKDHSYVFSIMVW